MKKAPAPEPVVEAVDEDTVMEEEEEVEVEEVEVAEGEW